MNEAVSDDRLKVDAGDTLANVLRRRIADDILSGVCKPGTRLEERALAKQFGVSRTPVREALQQLTLAGLATSKPRSGTVVSNVEPARVMSLCEANILLETLCARVAAGRISAVELGRLRRLHAACEACHASDDADGYALENRMFHSTVIEATRNIDLGDAVELCRLRIAPYQRLPFRSAERRADSQREHQNLIEALALGDAEAAAKAMHQHLSAASLAIDDCVQKL